MHTILEMSFYSFMYEGVKELECTFKYNATQKSHSDLKIWQ